MSRTKPKQSAVGRREEPTPSHLAKLNVRQRAFVAAYVSNGGNATRAAEAAGYCHASKKYMSWAATGSYLLNSLKIKLAIQEEFRARSMGPEEVIARLVEHAKGNAEQFFDARWRFKRSALREKGHLIKRLKAPAKGRPAEIELHDAQAALALIGKHMGLFSDKVEHVGDQGGPIRYEFTINLPAAPAGAVDATGPRQLQAPAIDVETTKGQ